MPLVVLDLDALVPFDRGSGTSGAYPEVDALIGGVGRRGWRVFVSSARWPAQDARRVLGDVGLARDVDAVFGTEPSSGASDEAAPLRSALASGAVPAWDAVVVAPGHRVIASARAGGAATVGATWGHASPLGLEGEAPDWICGAPGDALAIIEGWFGMSPDLVSRAEILHGRRAPRERPAGIPRPGPGQRSVWDFPRPPRIEPEPRRVRVVWAGRDLIDTRSALRVLETASPPTYYVPFPEASGGSLVPSNSSSVCEWKGLARYWSLRGAERSSPDAAWCYPSPLPGFEALRGRVAFFPSRVDACWLGDEVACPQSGGFYGGWITDDVTGPFKGDPGSERW